PVRDGQVAAHVGRDRPLALEHRLDVLGVHRPGADQDLARLPDGLLLGAGPVREDDVARGEDVAHACTVAGPAATTSRTTSSYTGLARKFSTDTCRALGACRRARSVSSVWVITRSTSSWRFATALLTTVTSG